SADALARADTLVRLEGPRVGIERQRGEVAVALHGHTLVIAPGGPGAHPPPPAPPPPSAPPPSPAPAPPPPPGTGSGAGPGSSWPPAPGMTISGRPGTSDRKSTRLNSSHVSISYAVFCLKKKTQTAQRGRPHTT